MITTSTWHNIIVQLTTYVPIKLCIGVLVKLGAWILDGNRILASCKRCVGTVSCTRLKHVTSTAFSLSTVRTCFFSSEFASCSFRIWKLWYSGIVAPTHCNSDKTSHSSEYMMHHERNTWTLRLRLWLWAICSFSSSSRFCFLRLWLAFSSFVTTFVSLRCGVEIISSRSTWYSIS